MPASLHQLAWSERGTEFVSVDLFGKLTVWSCAADPDETTLVSKTFDTRVPGTSIKQILFSPDSRHLIVSSGRSTRVFSIQERTWIATRDFGDEASLWVCHPCDNSTLLRCNFGMVQLFGIKELNLIHTYRMVSSDGISTTPSSLLGKGLGALALDSDPTIEDTNPTETQAHMERTFVSPDKSIIVLEASHTSSEGTWRCHRVIDPATIPIKQGTPSESLVAYAQMPRVVEGSIQQAFGFFVDQLNRKRSFQDRALLATTQESHVLAFLDRDFWVCSCSLLDNRSGIRRHFFLPRDWWNFESLELAVVTRMGTLLCPRNGEIAVVENGFREEWRD